jgi:hypothetical protein
MVPYGKQIEYAKSVARFNMAACGRRSGKTEKAKRKLIAAALSAHNPKSRFFSAFEDPRLFAAAPTRDQVKRIYWADLKALAPKHLVKNVNESALVISFINGAQICCLGMDKPERMEGAPWNGGVLDEYADMKSDVWAAHVRPMLADRAGWCDLIGVPEGRNHYYDLWKKAEEWQVEATKQGKRSDWRRHHWTSAEILPLYGRGEELEAMRRDMDPITYRQEAEASFENFTGLAYYSWDETLHVAPLKYDPKSTLIFCFDFNVDPGTAVVCQEQLLPSHEQGTGVIGEVFIPYNSNTPMVLRKLIGDWKDHEGMIECYGDPTGGARGSAKVEGSEWEIIRRWLYATYTPQRVTTDPGRASPRERDRINAVNSRLLSADGRVRLQVDPTKAPHMIRDFENTVVVEGGSGEIDKKHNKEFSHGTDAVGYMCQRLYPVRKEYVESGQTHWN